MLPEELLEAIGTPVDATEPSETYTARFGEAHLCLRRDCHGILRRVELSFAESRREIVRKVIPQPGTWQTVAPGTLDLVDLPHLGKVYLLADRLTLSVRLDPDSDRLRKLLLELVRATG